MSNLIFAPRPGYQRATVEYRLGMLALNSSRYRCLGSLRWYRQAQRIHKIRIYYAPWTPRQSR